MVPAFQIQEQIVDVGGSEKMEKNDEKKKEK